MFDWIIKKMNDIQEIILIKYNNEVILVIEIFFFILF